jgi:hypothetical protein
MRKEVLFLTLLFVISIEAVSGQETDKTRQSPWSITLGYAPTYNFNLSKYVPSEFDYFYFFGFAARADFKMFNKISFSAGLNIRRKEKDYLIFAPSDTWKPIWLDAHESRFLLEFPIQMNYHLLNSYKTFDPYLKIAVKNIYYNRKMNGKNQDGVISVNDNQYNLLADIGFGSSLRISNSFSLVVETNFGYCLIFDLQNRGYLDGLLGLQYRFK